MYNDHASDDGYGPNGMADPRVGPNRARPYIQANTPQYGAPYYGSIATALGGGQGNGWGRPAFSGTPNGMMGGVGSSGLTKSVTSTDQWGNPRYSVYDANGTQVGGAPDRSRPYITANTPQTAVSAGMRGPGVPIGPK